MCDQPLSWEMVRRDNEILLKPGEEVPLLFKFLTFREVNASKQPGPDIVKARRIQIVFKNSAD